MVDESETPGAHDLNELVADCIARMEEEGPGALESVCRQHPDFADRIRTRVRMLAESGMLSSGDELDDVPERLGDFRLVRRLGGGGMGVVYLAVQESLGREVALKLIRRDQLYFPGARQRFYREVEAVARMQHPAIVPVYAVGEESGVPYFAMERIIGATLQDLLHEFLGRAPFDVDEAELPSLVEKLAGGGAAPAEWKFRGNYREWCLGVIRDVAGALEHAHQRGVLHRDIKPSNVIIGLDGRVHLVDFGLARAAGAQSLTTTGTLMGSIPYMAPELLKGHSADERTDLYGLGALLYELSTFRPPFGIDSMELLATRIIEDDPRSPRLSNPTLLVDDESVCLKALEKDPARRYQTARDFADDVDNLLNHRPVRARPASTVLRFRRFVQRRPGATSAVVLGFVLVVVAPTVFAIQQHRARIQVEAARDESERQRVRAEENLVRAREAVDLLLHEAGARLLQGVPLMDGVRRVILESAAKFYEPLLGQEPTSERMRYDLALIRRSLSHLYEDLGRREEARRMYDALIVEFENLRRVPSLSTKATFQLASMFSSRAEMRIGDGETVEAFADWQRARDLFPIAIKTWSGDQQALFQCAMNDLNDAQARATLGQFARARELIDRAIENAAKASEMAPEDPDAQTTLAGAYVVRANLAYMRRDLESAVEDLEESVPVLRKLLKGDRPTWNVRRVYLGAAANWGASLMALQRAEEAREVLEDAVEVGDALIAAFPTLSSIVFQLAQTYTNLGLAYSVLGDGDAAFAAQERALELNRAAIEHGETGDDALQALAVSLSNFASAVRERGDLDRADALLREAEGLFQRVAPDLGANPLFVRQRQYAVLNHGLNEIQRGHFGDAFAMFDAVAGEEITDQDVAEALTAMWLQLAKEDSSRASLAEDRSLVALRRAVALGWAKPEVLADPDFDRLRDRPEFQAIEDAVGGAP